MDEPTAALTSHEIERLFGVIRDLRSHGIGIIYISHRLEEVYTICDRIVVLRDGENAGEGSVASITRAQLITMMVGRELKDEFPRRSTRSGEPRLAVRGLSRGSAVRDVSFDVRRGEVLAITGLVGAGRTETARLIFGADTRTAGEIALDGTALRIRSPRDAVASGIGLLTEDRKGQGLVLAHGVRENFGLPNLSWLSRAGFVRQREERAAFGKLIESMRIKVPHQDQPARHLSGGNQQKVVLAKWLARRCEVLIFDEPTRGVDVGAKFEIYQLINELAAQGKAIVMISSELPEVLGMADRILVMRGGCVVGEFSDARTATQEQIMECAFGGRGAASSRATDIDTTTHN
jgi:ABC-type sugar transport system ATPase subunit